MTSPKVVIDSVSISAKAHIYDGTVDGVKYHFVDKNADQIVNSGDSLDFYVQLAQYNFPTCEDILKGKSQKITSTAKKTCKKMGNLKYKEAIEGRAKSFEAALTAELQALKKSVSDDDHDLILANLCEDAEEESTFVQKDNLKVADIDSNETVDEVAFTTTDGISVYISAIEMSCKPAKQQFCCKEVDATRAGVAKYLSIFDPLFDYIKIF